MLEKVISIVTACLIMASIAIGQKDQSPESFLPKPVCLAGKSVYINTSGKVILKTDFDYHWSDNTAFSEGLAAFRENKKYGFIDETGKVVIKPTFDYVAAEFSEGLALVIMNNKYGFIDKTGKFVIEPIYDTASSFKNSLALVTVYTGLERDILAIILREDRAIITKRGFIDKTGAMIVGKTKKNHIGKFDRADQFSEGLAAVKIDGKWGYVNTKGETVIKFKFRNAKSFSEDLALATIDGKNWGFIDKSGEFVIKPQFTSANEFSEGLAGVSTDKNLVNWGFIDKAGNIVIKPDFREVFDFKQGVATVFFRDSSFGYIDKTGKSIFETRFAGASVFKNGLAYVLPEIYGETGTRYGEDYIDRAGNYIWKAKEKNEQYGKSCNN